MSRPWRATPALPGALAACLLLSALVPAGALAASSVAPEVAEPAGERPEAEVAAARQYFTDVELVDQDGQEQRLYSDLMADRVVVIAAMFTTCEGVCPVTMANFKKIQQWLGPRLGKDVHLLAISVDPEHDTPEKMRAYAEQFQAEDGWHFLTGEPETVEAALRRLGLFTDVKESHSPVFLVGNERTGMWKKAMGLAGATALLDILESVLRDRRPESAAADTAPAAEGAGR